MPAQSTKPRVLFCSYHSYLDPSSGAALSTRDLLELMVAHGWECAVLSGPELDFEQGASFETILRAHGVRYQYRPGKVRDTECTLYHGVLNGVPLHSFIPAAWQPRQPPTRDEGRAFLSLFDLAQKRFRPDILFTYGGQWVAFHLIRRARQRGLKVAFVIHNFAYDQTNLFEEVDAILVPSRAAQEHYKQTLGLSSTAIPGPWNWERVCCSEVRGAYVTFVNPQPAKGVFVFARIVAELARRRPDIPFLVVEGRARSDWLARAGLDLAQARNLKVMANTPDPREFYRVSRLVLVPSLVRESFPRVPAEAMMNGIPVLASRRGGLPEVLAEAGFLFNISEQYTPTTLRAPTAAEVAQWVETIERLWDDAAFHAAESERCRRAAEAWRPERLWPRYEDYFRGLLRPES